MKYVIRTDVPFAGYCQSTINPDGNVAWSGGLSFEAYQAANPDKVLKVVDDVEMDQILAAYEQSLITEPKSEDQESFDWALNCLPPCRWHHFAGVELFHVSERITGDLVSWHASLNGSNWTFVDLARATSEHLSAKVAQAALERANG